MRSISPIAAGGTVQTGRRPPSQRRGAALIALGAHCGTRTGAALSNSSFLLGRDDEVENYGHEATNGKADDALIVTPRYTPAIEISPHEHTPIPSKENTPRYSAGWCHPTLGAFLIRPLGRRKAEVLPIGENCILEVSPFLQCVLSLSLCFPGSGHREMAKRSRPAARRSKIQDSSPLAGSGSPLHNLSPLARQTGRLLGVPPSPVPPGSMSNPDKHTKGE